MDENNQEVVSNGRKVIRLSRKKFVISIAVLVLVVIPVLIFILLSDGFYAVGLIGQLLGYVIPLCLLIVVIFFILGVVGYFITTDLIKRTNAKKRIRNSIIWLVVIILFWAIIRMMTNTFGVGPEQLNSSAIPCVPQYTPDGRALGNCDGGSEGTEMFSVGSSFSRSKSSNLLPSMYDGGGKASIGDTREFLKTDYRSTIETRDVNSIVRYVKNAVAGADGRVDNISSGEKYGYVSFVVAKSKFEDFRSEVESLVHAKLYTENISSENLLTQKQGIEQQQGNIVNSLSNFENQKSNLTIDHNKTVSSINKEITRIQKELTYIRTSMSNTTDESIFNELAKQEASLVKQETAQRNSLASENNKYSIQKQNLDNLINNENNNLTNINQVDSDFMDNVETVNGYITVRWINLWEMAKIFSPIHPIFVIIIILIILWASFRKSKFVPKVVLE